MGGGRKKHTGKKTKGEKVGLVAKSCPHSPWVILLGEKGRASIQKKKEGVRENLLIGGTWKGARTRN